MRLVLPDGLTAARVLPPRLRPLDLRAFLVDLLGDGRVFSRKRLATETGWPFERFELDGRVVALYHLEHHVAALVCAEASDELLARVRPDFRGEEIACLEDLFA